MARLIIAADIHGHYQSWQLIKGLIRPGDVMAIAGDLFDTKYQCIARDEFDPERIRNEFSQLPINNYYVYGNCDHPDFFPEQKKTTDFVFQGKRIHMRHGHFKKTIGSSVDILIEGHTHIARLEHNPPTTLINPGSIPLPRSGVPSYAVLEQQKVRLIHAETHQTIMELNI